MLLRKVELLTKFRMLEAIPANNHYGKKATLPPAKYI